MYHKWIKKVWTFATVVILISVTVVLYILLRGRGGDIQEVSQENNTSVEIPVLTPQEKEKIEKAVEEVSKTIPQPTDEQKADIEKRMEEFNSNATGS